MHITNITEAKSHFSALIEKVMGDLPLIHRDPFDRMLIAQAKTEGFTIITRDSRFKKYKVPIIKA